MKKIRWQAALILLAGIVLAYFADTSTQAQRQRTASAVLQRQWLNDYCVSCHSQKKQAAGLVLEGLNPSQISTHNEIWEKVLRKVRTGQMPPANAPQPERAEAQAFADWLEAALDREARLRPNPGRPAVHLNEKNALGPTPIDIADRLPIDQAVDLLTELIIKSGAKPKTPTIQ